MNSNFQVVRDKRRQIIKQLEKQQLADAEAALKLRNIFIASHKNILDALVGMLGRYSPDYALCQHERDFFEPIVGSEFLDQWLAMRCQDLEIDRKLSQLRPEFRSAKQNYDEVSPLGGLSRMFKNNAEKNISDALLAERDRLASEVASAEKSQSELICKLQTHAESFFRKAMEKENLNILGSAPSPVMNEIKGLLSKMNEEISQFWADHVATQRGSLSEISNAMSAIVSIYDQVHP